MNGYKIAVVGAGIYGSSIAIKLAEKGYIVDLFDPLGIMRASSVVNQFRIHSGYHYPRSPDTISEILEAKNEFIDEYKPSVVKNTEAYYAIPHEKSRTSPNEYEDTMRSFNLDLKSVKPHWINFDFIDKCYLVDEYIYDPDKLRSLINHKINSSGVNYIGSSFKDSLKDNYDFTVYATYGSSGSHMHLFEKMKLQVAEKVLIKLPNELNKKSLVVVDGPFTAFDPYGATDHAQFGSALCTNHWVTSDPNEPIPEKYSKLINQVNFVKVSFSHFEDMVSEAKKAVPLTSKAQYLGSKFTLRLVEDDPANDRRILRVGQSDDRTFHVFSGKVVSAIKAARIVTEKINNA